MNDIYLGLSNDIENLKLPDPQLTTYWRDRQDRVFWIDTEITDELFEVSKMILRYNKEDKGKPTEERQKITLFINSPGGDLDATLAFVNLIELSKTPVITINAGMAMSAAGLILMAGHERYALPGTSCLIHSGSASGMGGTYEQTESAMEDYKQKINDMKSFILKKTTIDPKILNKRKSTDWYIYTQDMLDNGIVDKIICDLDEIV